MIQSVISSTDEDDLSGSAGWMYADLLIGLMVVFLATITFVPATNNLMGTGTKATGNQYFYTYSRVIQDKPLSILIEDNQLPDLVKLISDFKARNGIAQDATVAYVQIVGAYRSNLENQQSGVSRALALSQRIENEYHSLFSTASTTFNTTTSIPSNQAVVRLLFAEVVSVGKE
jgi:hypothetical protein